MRFFPLVVIVSLLSLGVMGLVSAAAPETRDMLRIPAGLIVSFYIGCVGGYNYAKREGN